MVRRSLALLIFFLSVTPADAATVLINSTLDTAASGSSCTGGLTACTLRAAIVKAVDGDTIQIGTILYTPVGVTSDYIYISGILPTIDKNLTINLWNANAGMNEHVRVAAGSTTGMFVISNHSVSLSNVDLAYGSGLGGCLAATGSVVTIHDSTFVNCHAIGDGGAILGASTHLSVYDTIFVGNSADSTGGAVSLTGSNLAPSSFHAERTIISRNTASSAGGAVSLTGYFSELTMDQVSFTNNKTPGPGGAVYLDGTLTAAGTIANSTFDSNEAGTDGGALSVSLSGATSVGVSDSVFTNNKAGTNASNGGNGGAASCSGCRFERVTFAQNQALLSLADGTQGRGGALALPPGGPASQVLSCTFDSNQAEVGGAIWARNELTLSLSTLVANTAGRGGALAVDQAGTSTQASALLRNTIARNHSQHEAGALLLACSAPPCSLAMAFTSLSHNIIAHNTAEEASASPVDANCNQLALGVGSGAYGHNLTTDTTCGLNASAILTTAAGLAPSLAANASTGPQTLALLWNSPAIDGGDAGVAAANAVGADQRGRASIDATSGAAGGAPDIGAYEFGGAGLLRFSSTDVTATEGTSAALAVELTGATTADVTVTPVEGTASLTTDIVPPVWPGSTVQQGTPRNLTVDIVSGDAREPEETLTVVLATTSAVDVGRPATIRIPADVPDVAFATASASVNEAGGSLAVTVTLSWPVLSSVTVPLTLTSAGVVSLAAPSVTFFPGATSATATLSWVDDSVVEPDVSVALDFGPTLSEAVPSLSGSTRFTLTIVDDDTPLVTNPSSAASGNERGGAPGVTSPNGVDMTGAQLEVRRPTKASGCQGTEANGTSVSTLLLLMVVAAARARRRAKCRTRC